MVLVMGGGSLLTCSTFLLSAKIEAWMRYAGGLALFALGLASIAAGLVVAFKKKPEAKPKPKRKAKEVELDPATRQKIKKPSTASDT